jgi:hypothetical protein
MFKKVSNVSKIPDKNINITNSNGDNLLDNDDQKTSLRPGRDGMLTITAASPVDINVRVNARELVNITLVNGNDEKRFTYEVTLHFENETSLKLPNTVRCLPQGIF